MIRTPRSDHHQQQNANMSRSIVSLGRSPSAALEKLYRQTEALVDELSKAGGPASFLNLRKLLDDRSSEDLMV